MEGEDVEVLDVGADQGGDNAEEPIEQVDAGVSGDGDAGASPEGDKHPDTEAPKDGRYGSKEFKADFAKIKAIDPAAAKAFERAYWKVAGVDKLGTTQELTALKEAVELHGGVEALSQMAEEVQAGRQLEQGFKAGDPKVIEGWATDYPDGFKKLMLPALDRLERLDPKFHEQVVGTAATKFLENYGVFDAIGQMGEALRGGKTDEAIRLYNDLVGKVFQPMRGLATKSTTDPLASEREKIESERQELASEKKTQFYGSVRGEVNQQVGRAMNAELGKLLRGRKLDAEMGNRVRSEVTSEIKQLLTSQADYAKRYETIMGAGDRDKAIKFIVDNATRNMSKAVQTVLKYRNLLNGNGARPAARPAPKPGAPQTIAGRPNIADVDFGRTDKATFLGSRTHGTAYLKNGKTATW
jgi:hypothetical protein